MNGKHFIRFRGANAVFVFIRNGMDRALGDHFVTYRADQFETSAHFPGHLTIYFSRGVRNLTRCLRMGAGRKFDQCQERIGYFLTEFIFCSSEIRAGCGVSQFEGKHFIFASEFMKVLIIDRCPQSLNDLTECEKLGYINNDVFGKGNSPFNGFLAKGPAFLLRDSRKPFVNSLNAGDVQISN